MREPKATAIYIAALREWIQSARDANPDASADYQWGYVAALVALSWFIDCAERTE